MRFPKVGPLPYSSTSNSAWILEYDARGTMLAQARRDANPRSGPVQKHFEYVLMSSLLVGVTSCGDAQSNGGDGSVGFGLELGAAAGPAAQVGNASVAAVFNGCPVLDGLTAGPISLLVGGVSSLAVLAHDSDNGPSPLAYSWAVNGVPLPLQTASTLAFTCSAAGAVTITASVSDGDPNPACADALSVTVSCE